MDDEGFVVDEEAVGTPDQVVELCEASSGVGEGSSLESSATVIALFERPRTGMLAASGRARCSFVTVVSPDRVERRAWVAFGLSKTRSSFSSAPEMN